jgi:hypothetical protein
LFAIAKRDIFMAPLQLKRSPLTLGLFGIRNKIFVFP